MDYDRLTSSVEVDALARALAVRHRLDALNDALRLVRAVGAMQRAEHERLCEGSPWVVTEVIGHWRLLLGMAEESSAHLERAVSELEAALRASPVLALPSTSTV
jgi:hypothetical protein